MGNAPSNQSVHSPTSIRSRSSRKGGTSIDQQTARVSHAVSFYQTPPGSFDPDRPLSFAPPTDAPVSESSREESPSPVQPRPPTPAHIPDVPVEPVRAKWRPGVYSLVNVRSGTAVDLSGADSKSIIGYPSHSGKNQQWRFEPLGEGYSIWCLYSGTYLTLEEGLAEGSSLVASLFPVSWKVERMREDDQVIIRILWPNNKFAVDLADLGSAIPGTKVQLARSNPDDLSQQWHLIERDALSSTAPSPSAVSSPLRTLESMSSSPPVETVVVSEDHNCVTTTRTTTTSTVMTVTTVTKTPRAT